MLDRLTIFFMIYLVIAKKEISINNYIYHFEKYLIFFIL